MNERSVSTARRWLLVAAVLALGLLTAACGGNEAADGIATLGDDDTTADVASEDGGDGGDDEPATEEERQEALLEFAQCMRDHGIDMADPEFGEGGRVTMRAGAAGGQGEMPDETKMDAANEACQPIMEGVVGGPEDMDPEEVERRKAEALEFAQCIRDHGIDMPDPQFGEGGGMTQRMNVEVDDTAFEAAAEECGNGQFGIGAAPAEDDK